MRCQLIPPWWKKSLKDLPATFKARADTVAEKPMFRDAIQTSGAEFQRTFLSYFDAESFFNAAMASCTVVMNCAGKMMVEFFSTEISAMVWRVRS